MNEGAARPYRQMARAAQVAATGERIVAAALELYHELWLDEITLEQVAARAGVSTKTLYRRYGDRDGLVRSVSAALAERVATQRFDVRPGDVDDAAANLISHYENVGALALRNAVQSQRFREIAALVEFGRDEHRRWVRHAFGPWLTGQPHIPGDILFAQLFAITDVSTWHVLRTDLGLDARRTHEILRGLIAAVLGERRA